MKKLLKGALYVGFVVSVTGLAWFNIYASIVSICAVVLVVIYGKLESLVEFSFGPLRAKIERNLSQSEKLLNELKSYAATQAKNINLASVSTGRFASGDDWIFQAVKRTEDGLRRLEVDEEQLVEARQDFVRITISDAARAAMGGNYVPIDLGQDAVREWHAIMRDQVREPEAVEAYLTKWNVLTPERAERIADMRWMIANRDVRDSAQYMRAHTHVPWKPEQS